LVESFRAQNHDDNELIILDDSPTPSTVMATIAGEDSRITYRFSPEPLSIGTKRNVLVDLCTGDHIVQFDDDDYYAPHYLTYMSGQLERVDFFTLTGWYLLNLASSFFGYWDTATAGPVHYAVSPGQPARLIDEPFLYEPSFLDNAWGYGFSYAFTKEAAVRTRFADRDWGEDYDFFLRLRDAGFSVDGEPDTSGLVLHIIHGDNTSRTFPQYRLPMHHLGPTFGKGLGKAFPGLRHLLSTSYNQPIAQHETFGG
jgi:glycosyltransferase involved in cell wall biosynthesis